LKIVIDMISQIRDVIKQYHKTGELSPSFATFVANKKIHLDIAGLEKHFYKTFYTRLKPNFQRSSFLVEEIFLKKFC